MLEETLNRMRQAIGSGDFSQAEELGKSQIANHPDSLPLLKGLAIAIGLQNRSADALVFFNQAHKLAPDDIDIMYNIATLTLELGQLNTARKMFEDLYSRNINQPEIYMNYINVLIGLHETKVAENICQEAIDLFPNNPDLIATVVSVYELNNDLEKAEHLLDQTPKSDVVWLMTARVKRRLECFNEAMDAINFCNPEKLDMRSLSEFHWEKAMIQEKHKQFDQAWQNFSYANEAFSKIEKTKTVDASIFWQEIEWLQDIARKGLPCFPDCQQMQNDPVFFVGFPRSGTTLMEQILKAHSKIITTEEESPLENLLGEIRQDHFIGDFFEKMDEETLERLRARFWQISEEIVGKIDNKVLLDKLPLNILWVQIIRILFPKSKIVVAYRDPRDVCISAFIQKFRPNAAMVNFLDWHQTAKTYDAVMNVWFSVKENLEGPIFEYRYEDLTDDYLKVVEALLDYLNLEIEPNIKDYRVQAKNRVIKTPSYREVVNPINKNAVERWKNYPSQTAEVSPVLQKWIDKLSYES